MLDRCSVVRLCMPTIRCVSSGRGWHSAPFDRGAVRALSRITRRRHHGVLMLAGWAMRLVFAVRRLFQMMTGHFLTRLIVIVPVLQLPLTLGRRIMIPCIFALIPGQRRTFRDRGAIPLVPPVPPLVPVTPPMLAPTGRCVAIPAQKYWGGRR
jgi:hypothetical protein